jgi:hypothetical protein
MNILLKMLPHNLPAFVRRKILAELFEATADAFECPAPAHGHLSLLQRSLAIWRPEPVEGRGTLRQAQRAIPGRLGAAGSGADVHDECLRAYALFTREQAEKALQAGRDLPALKARLYQNAYPLGGKLRKWLGVDTMEEVMELGQILYRAIGVEIEGDAQGDVTVSRCYFSQFYSGPVCDLISALDDGVFSGLSGGGRLAFSERLTEGRERCRAKLQVRSN